MKTNETKELGWNWPVWNHSSTRGAATTHYANLTRGVKCAPRNSSLCRIQSTQCEAGRWERVLLSVPDELIARTALGQFIVVHDYSEKPRETRAMWQGLSLTRIMMEFRWYGELRSRFTSPRGGKSAIQYLRNVASQQPEHVRRKYDYFRDLALESSTASVSIVSCRSASHGRYCAYGRTEARDPTCEVTASPTSDRPPSNLW